MVALIQIYLLIKVADAYLLGEGLNTIAFSSLGYPISQVSQMLDW